MKLTLKNGLIGAGVALVLLVAGVAIWFFVHKDDDEPKDFAASNGRLEATEVNVASKMAGRVQEILVKEGDLVKQNDVLAKMDMSALQAQLLQARAELANAISRKDAAQAQISQRDADAVTAQAVLLQRNSELDLAGKTAARSKALLLERATSVQEADNDSARLNNARAAVTVAKAQIATADAGIRAAHAQVQQAEAGILAADAGVKRLESDLEDGILRAPLAGRVQFRVAQPGEVVGNGGNVLSLIDLSDVYMTFFLPTNLAGRVALGADVRLVLDAAKQYVIPAKVSFVADVAQFTPKTVETESEREKLMFRIKARIDPELLKKNIHNVKTGVPGVAHVQLNASQPWAKELKVNLP
ncbi:MAG: HlyD family efflux transporter periplasmic adaptor subunit [Proteobacteria bacterium]|nr:HlyD family efflux transporter periplasmic adaptor subunit [Pseudomonadota bacterium]